MAISVTNLGTGSGANDASTATLTTSGAVPAGAVIFVCGTANAGVSASSVGDGGSNTYTKQVSNTGVGALYTCPPLRAQLASSSTITFTWSAGNNGWSRAMSAAYATGIASGTADQTASAEATSSSSESATTSALTQTGELAIGVMGYQNGAETSITVTDGGTGTWTSLNTENVANATGVTNTACHMAYQVLSAATATTYTATPSTSANSGLAALIATFYAAYPITDLGSANSSSGNGTVSLTIPAGGVPVGATLFVAINDVSFVATYTGETLVDTGLNTYSLVDSVAIDGSGTAQGWTALWAAPVTTALVSGNTITYDCCSATAKVVIDVFYVTGLGPLDSATLATADGSSAAPSVTSGTPAVKFEFFVGVVGWNIATGTFTQEAGWYAPPDNSQTTPGQRISGGTFVDITTGTVTYAPTITSTVWGAIIAGWKPAATGVQQLLMMMGLGS